MKSRRSMTSSTDSSMAVTRAVRPSVWKRATSPKTSPGPRMCSVALRPALLGATTFSLPVATAKRDSGGSPRSMITCPAGTRWVRAQAAMLLDGCDADVMAGGHTHIPMLRQHRGRWVVNPGSVGMPFRRYVGGARPEIMPCAEYAIVDDSGPAIGVELRRVPLERAALREEARAWPAPPELLRADLLLQYA